MKSNRSLMLQEAQARSAPTSETLSAKAASLFGCLLVAATIACLGSAPVALAQESDRPSGPRVTVEVQGVINQDEFSGLPQRTPITFRPLELRDPVTKQPVTPETILTLSNGTQISAREYFAQLNRLELALNARGYSLRDRKSIHAALKPGASMDVERDAQAIRESHEAFDSRKMVAPKSIEELKADAAREGFEDAARLQALGDEFARQALPVAAPGGDRPARCLDCEPGDPPPPPPPAPPTVRNIKTWNSSLGDSSTLSAQFSGRLQLVGTNDYTSLQGEANAGITFQNIPVNLVRATGSLTAPRTGNSLIANLSLSVLGNTIYNLNETATGSLTRSGVYQFPGSINYSQSYNFFPITLKVGATGGAEVEYFLDVRPVSATAKLVPRVNSSAFAQAGVGFEFLGVGVGGSISPINGRTELYGQVSLKSDQRGPYVFQQYYGHNQYDLLRGRLYLWGCVVACGEWTIWDYPGFTVDGFMFNETLETPLIP